MKKTIIWVVVIILVIVGIYFLVKKSSDNVVVENDINNSNLPVKTATSTATTTKSTDNSPTTVIGTSAEGRDITAYHYGTGADEVLFVGGIHGSYEENTITLANKLMDYLKANPKVIPANVRVTVIPVLNPDGANKGEGDKVAGRFNGNNVDLNRNFDCDWQTNGVWQNKTVSGGTSAFSEPESQAVKNYIANASPKAVVVYYSAAGGVYSSNCHNGILPETSDLTKLYAKASGYPAYQEFNYYETTGDMTNWLAKINVPAISVLLTNHTDVEWSMNQAGALSVLKYYAK